jgi:signal transduction histidine kinase/ActR/RegA family two-component response regulator
MEHYKNDVPLVACLLMVFLVVFTSIVFYIYDHLMNREAVHKDLVMQTKRQYVRYISHEIRTPLNVVNLGFQVLFTEMKRLQQRNQAILKPADEVVSTNDTAHIVVDCGSTGSTVNAANPTAETTGNQIADWIDLIHDIIESLNAGIGVLNDLIDYDKIDSGMMTLQKEALSTWSFVDKSVRPFIVQAKAKEINMEMHFHDNTDPENKSKYESLVVLGDRMKLSQVFRNLISNALKFTPAGGAVRMEVRWEEDQDAAKDNSNNKQHKTDKGFSNGRATTNNNTTQFWSRCLTRTKAEKTPLKTSDIHGLEAQYECAGKIVIEVSDSGAGMSEEQVKQLFREGVQFNPNDLQAGQGSGLGLWIAKGIVDSHGGELWASSEGIGKGTTFTLILPVFVQPAVCTPEKKLTKKLSLHDSFYRLISNMEEGRTSSANDGPDIEETTRISSSTSERKSMADQQNSDMDEDAACGIEKLDSDNSEMKQLNSIDLLLESKQSERFRHVLVTDDSAVNRKMMCRSLQSVGFKCFQAADGQECVDIVSKAMRNEHESIDLVLMDYEMPRMNGPTACAALRAMGCGIPVVGVTGNVLNEDKLFFLNHGAVKVIQKPISMADLEDVLRSV